jgi:type I restriction enzyme S subunit
MNAVFQKCQLGDVINLKRGYDLPKQKRVHGSVPILSSSGITDYHNEAKVEGPGVVTGRYGTLGEIFYVTEAYWPLNTSLYVQDFKGNDPRFISYFLGTLHLGSQNSAGAVPGLNRNHLHQLQVNLPDLPTQKKITGILSAYDDLIENNLRRIAILEELAQSLYREWFVHFRIPSEVLTKAGLPPELKLVDSPLGSIPEGWEVTSIEEACSRVTDGSHTSPKSVNDGMPMASSKDMHTFGLNLEKARQIGHEDYEKLIRNGCQPKASDILITKDGANYLKYIFVVEKDLDVVLLSSVAMLTLNELVNPHFFAAVLNSTENKQRLKNYVTGAAIPRIILKDFKRFQFLLPPKELQQRWAKIGENTTKQCWSLIEKNRNLRKTRDLLLPKFLS